MGISIEEAWGFCTGQSIHLGQTSGMLGFPNINCNAISKKTEKKINIEIVQLMLGVQTHCSFLHCLTRSLIYFCLIINARVFWHRESDTQKLQLKSQNFIFICSKHRLGNTRLCFYVTLLIHKVHVTQQFSVFIDTYFRKKIHKILVLYTDLKEAK